MTISSTDNRVSYAGDGSTTVFSYPYRFLLETDLVVIEVDDATAVETTLVLSTNYTVSGAGDAGGGDVTITPAPAAGKTIVILNDPPITQGYDPEDGSALGADSLETAFDRLTLINQRQSDQIGRAFRKSDGDTSGSSTVLPVPLENRSFKYVDDGAGGLKLALTTYDPDEAQADAEAAKVAAEAAQTAAEAAQTAAEAAEAGAETARDEALDGVFGQEFAGDPNGNLSADELYSRAWDTSKTPPQLYFATAADGSVGGTTWKRAAAVLRSITAQPNTATDGATDAYAVTVDVAPASGESASILFGSANTTATPTLAINGGSATSLVDAFGNAWSGMIEPRVHTIYNDGTNYVVVDPRWDFGMGQSWQDLTGSRSSNTVYTNSTGRPIMMSVGLIGTSSTSTRILLDGVQIDVKQDPVDSAFRSTNSFIVPDGSTYEVETQGGLSIDRWLELR